MKEIEFQVRRSLSGQELAGTKIVSIPSALVKMMDLEDVDEVSVKKTKNEDEIVLTPVRKGGGEECSERTQEP